MKWVQERQANSCEGGDGMQCNVGWEGSRERSKGKRLLAAVDIDLFWELDVAGTVGTLYRARRQTCLEWLGCALAGKCDAASTPTCCVGT